MPGSTTTAAKPLSAIAAARLRAEASAKGGATPELTLDPVPLQPSSTPELDASDLEEEPLVVQRNLKLCSWRNVPQNVLSEEDAGLTVKLSKHTTISLIGAFQFKVLRGAININGANIGVLSRNGRKDQVYTSSVPATHPISKIRGLDGVNHVQFSSWGGPTTLAGISPLHANIWNVPTDVATSRSFTVITESEADPLARALCPEVTPEDWLRAIEECATSPSIIMAVGSPKSGKSTFTGRLLNRYLTGQGKSARPVPAVYYLDLDPAKPEFTPHGQVSLVAVRSLDLGPSFTHFSVPTSSLSAGQNETIRSHPVPSDLANYRDHYRSCAEDLFLTYKTLQSHNPLVPLLITIPGSLYDSDFDFLMSLLVRFKPHHVIHLGGFQESDTDDATKLHVLQTAASQYRGAVHEITSHVPSYPSMRTECELRAMQMQSYFHLRSANMNGENPSTWSAAPMTKHVPWEFCFEETEERMQDFAGFAMYSEPIEAISLVHALNGSVVQIVQSTSSTVPACYTSLPRTNRHRIPYFPKSGRTGIVEPLDPRTSQLVCTALVRGFDAARKVVQLLIPKTHENLLYTLSPERTIFVGGCCDTPDWAFVEEVHATAVVERDGSMCALGAPWVQDGFLVDNMGYLDTVRRVRKFQT